MQLKVGDRISTDAIKVGQARRTGRVLDVTEGLSGTRLRVRWDDGVETVFTPSYGSVVKERRGRSSASARSGTSSKKSKAASGNAKRPARASAATKKAAKTSRAKPAAKAKTAAKKATKKAAKRR